MVRSGNSVEQWSVKLEITSNSEVNTKAKKQNLRSA